MQRILQKNWIEITPVTKGSLSKENIPGLGVIEDMWDFDEIADTSIKHVYYDGAAVIIDGKFFIKKEQVIAYE